jgi:hypothetical protein
MKIDQIALHVASADLPRSSGDDLLSDREAREQQARLRDLLSATGNHTHVVSEWVETCHGHLLSRRVRDAAENEALRPLTRNLTSDGVLL